MSVWISKLWLVEATAIKIDRIKNLSIIFPFLIVVMSVIRIRSMCQPVKHLVSNGDELASGSMETWKRIENCPRNWRSYRVAKRQSLFSIFFWWCFAKQKSVITTLISLLFNFFWNSFSSSTVDLFSVPVYTSELRKAFFSSRLLLSSIRYSKHINEGEGGHLLRTY